MKIKSKMKIKKAKLKNRSLDIDYDETKTFMNPEGEMIESKRELSAKCYDICHDSLVAAFDRLRVHAVLIADLRESLQVENMVQLGTPIADFDPEELKNILITGFVVVGNSDDGSEGAMIIFQKMTGTRVLNITTPTVKFEDPDYAYGNEFGEAIEACIFEVQEYMDGKVAVKQLDLDFAEGFDAEVSIDGVSIGSKKKGKKKKAEAFSPDEYIEPVTEHQEVA
jgi:DNA-directed RNA polymerase subunit L